MAKTAWMANKWGGSTSVAPTPVIGEDECGICMHSAVQIRFLPCKHGSCLPCIERLRAGNVLKADAGIRCHICRQFVEMYEAMDTSAARQCQDQVNDFLVSANKAANAAAQARKPAPKKPRPPQEAQAPPSQAAEEWICDCRRAHPCFHASCHACGKQGPKGSGPRPTGPLAERKDVLKCDHAELRAQAEEKYHPNFAQAFAEAGTPYQTSEAAGMTGGDAASAAAAAQQGRGQARLHHIIRQLCDHGHVKALAVHFFGNYTVQDLLDACGKFRAAAALLRERGGAPVEVVSALLGAQGGQDSLARLARGVVEALPEAASHAQGFYVVHKLLEVAAPAEALPVAARLLPEALKLTTPLAAQGAWRGNSLVIKLVDALCCLVDEGGHMASAAGAMLDSMCGRFLADERFLLKTAHHFHCGVMLVDAAAGGLPRPSCLQVLGCLAKHGPQLAHDKSGLHTLTALVSLTSPDAGKREIIVTQVCVLALALEGSFADIFWKAFEGEVCVSGRAMVGRMLDTLHGEGEAAWVQTIARELCAGAAKFIHNPRDVEALTAALCLPSIPDDALMADLEVLAAQVGEGKATEVVDALLARRPGLAQQLQGRPPQGGRTNMLPSMGNVQHQEGHPPAGAASPYSDAFASPPRSLLNGHHAGQAPPMQPPAMAPPQQQPPPPPFPGPSHAPAPPRASRPLLCPPLPFPPGAPSSSMKGTAPAVPPRQPPSTPYPHPPGFVKRPVLPPGRPVMALPNGVPTQPPPLMAPRPPAPPNQARPAVPPNLADLMPHLMIGLAPLQQQQQPTQPASAAAPSMPIFVNPVAPSFSVQEPSEQAAARTAAAPAKPGYRPPLAPLPPQAAAAAEYSFMPAPVAAQVQQQRPQMPPPAMNGGVRPAQAQQGPQRAQQQPARPFAPHHQQQQRGMPPPNGMHAGHMSSVRAPPPGIPQQLQRQQQQQHPGQAAAGAAQRPVRSPGPPAQQGLRPANGVNGAPMQMGSAPAKAWSCKVCTYNHTGAEADFLQCAMCGETVHK